MFPSLSLPLSVIFHDPHMEANKETPFQVNRFHVDEVHKVYIVEWNKKRKLQTDQLDLLRPKHKCRIGNSSSEHTLMFDENPGPESRHSHVVKGRTNAAFLDDNSEPASAKDSNSFTEDSNSAMSLNEEVKLEADSAKSYLYERPSTSFFNWDVYNIKDKHCSLDVSPVEKVSSSEEDTFIGNECNPSYHGADFNDLKNLEEHFLGLGSHSDHIYSEYDKDSTEHSIDKSFEDFLFSDRENPNMYVLSSGRWNVNQEAQSSRRPPTIDQEFEEYFSMLML